MDHSGQARLVRSGMAAIASVAVGFIPQFARAANYTIDNNTPQTVANLPASPLTGWLTVGDTNPNQSLTIGTPGYSAALLQIGNAAGSTGNTVVINGTAYSNIAGSPAITGPALLVGVDGSGNQLTISNAGSITISKIDGSSAYDLQIGYKNTASNNTLTVTGSGSTLSVNASTIYVGYSASGNTLRVADGGTVSALQMRVGGGTGSYGGAANNNMVVVTGVGSSLTTAGSFNLGATGSSLGTGNQLQVLDGAHVSIGVANSKTLTIGQADNANNNGATVSGAGSLLTVSNLVVCASSVTGNTSNYLSVDAAGALVSQTGITFNKNTLYIFGVGGASHASATAVGAIGIAANATFRPTLAAATPVTAHQTVLQGGTVSGTFSTLDASSLPTGFAPSLRYTSSAVWLDLTSQLGNGAGLDGNQSAVAAGINAGFNSAGATLPAGLLSLYSMDAATLARQLTLLSGEVAIGAQQVGLQMGSGFLRLLGDPLLQTVKEQNGVRLWLGGYGGYTTFNGNGSVGSHQLSLREGGLAIGGEYRLAPDTVVGVALGGGSANWSMASGLGSGRADAMQLGVYGKSWIESAYVMGALAFGNDWTNTTRAVMGEQPKGNFSAQTYSARLEGGYRLPVSSWGVTPYAALQVQNYRSPGYTETEAAGAGAAALNFASKSVTDPMTELGVRFEQTLPLASKSQAMTVRLGLAWAHDFNPHASMAASFASMAGTNFVVNGAPRARDAALVSAGLDWRLGERWSLFAGVETALAGQAIGFNAVTRIGITW